MHFGLNQSIAVFGRGPVSLLCMVVAFAVYVVIHRLECAKSYAAKDAFYPPPLQQGEANVAFSKRAAAAMKAKLDIDDRDPRTIDLVVDASGSEAVIQTSIRIVKTGGMYRYSALCI